MLPQAAELLRHSIAQGLDGNAAAAAKSRHILR
jgi:hypothetical protein